MSCKHGNPESACEYCDELNSLHRDYAEARKDAERYRWIRQDGGGQPRTRIMQYHHDIHLDRAIDAAIDAAKNPTGLPPKT